MSEVVDPRTTKEWKLLVDLKSDGEAEQWAELGTQKGFEPKYIGELWNALSSFLHSEMPRAKGDLLSHYRPGARMKPKIEEALKEIERLAAGTLVGSIVFKKVSFVCNCGQINQRSADAISNHDVINCVRESCKESYLVHKTDAETVFQSRSVKMSCDGCAREFVFPYRVMAEVPMQTAVIVECNTCKTRNSYMWRLMKKPAEVSSDSAEFSNGNPSN